MTDLPPDIAAASREVQQHYLKMLKNGCGERFAEMCALQIPPGTKAADRTFMQRRLNGEWLNDMPKFQADRMIREATAAGINTSGRYYMCGLADSRAHCDPEAWVDSVSDIKRVAQKRQLHVQGIINYTPPEQEPPKQVDINPRILREHVRKELKMNPKLKRQDAIEKVKDRIVPSWKRKK